MESEVPQTRAPVLTVQDENFCADTDQIRAEKQNLPEKIGDRETTERSTKTNSGKSNPASGKTEPFSGSHWNCKAHQQHPEQKTTSDAQRNCYGRRKTSTDSWLLRLVKQADLGNKIDAVWGRKAPSYANTKSKQKVLQWGKQEDQELVRGRGIGNSRSGRKTNAQTKCKI
jgi:hypothetical protein